MQNVSDRPRPEIAIGTPVYHPAYSRRGYVAAVDAPDAKTFTIGAGGMQPDRLELTIVWENDTISQVSENVADQWLRQAQTYNIAPVTDAADRLAIARTKEAERREAQQRDAQERARARTAFEADAATRIPDWAKAVILAELIVNESDAMTDYFASTTTRSVILGFSRHTRDLFPEMRKAALNYTETRELADAPPDAEHREKWSMGAGYYLKMGSRHSHGWRVSKRPLRQDGGAVKDLPTAEWAVPEAAPETSAPGSGTSGLAIEEHMHTKRGIPIFICVLHDRVSRADFDALRQAATSQGGWYSRPWRGTPGGFAFTDRASAERFAAAEQPVDDNDTGTEGKPVSVDTTRLRKLADAIQPAIDKHLADRLTNTPKRQRQAALARIEGRRLQRTQLAMGALADAHEAGTVPRELSDVTTKSDIYDLLATRIDRSSAGHFDAGIDTGEPLLDTPTAQALWRLVEDREACIHVVRKWEPYNDDL